MQGNDLFELGRQTLAQQPFSVLLRAELVRLEHGYAVLRVPLTVDVRQQNQYAHGGLVSYLADNALTFAAGSVLGANVLTTEFKINYLKPAIGSALTGHARCIHTGRRLAVCVTEVYDGDKDNSREMCAIAQGTVIKLSPTASGRIEGES
jgi:uncharacterized protein (TIGR00369 family)